MRVRVVGRRRQTFSMSGSEDRMTHPASSCTAPRSSVITGVPLRVDSATGAGLALAGSGTSASAGGSSIARRARSRYIYARCDVITGDASLTR